MLTQKKLTKLKAPKVKTRAQKSYYTKEYTNQSGEGSLTGTIRYDDKPWLRNYDKGVLKTLSYPKVTLSEVLNEVAENFPDSVAIIFFGRKITYKELKLYVDKLATALADLGVKKGDRVAIHLPNIPQFIIGFFGALRAGAIVVGCSLLYTENELTYLLNDSSAETTITLDFLLDLVNSIKDKTKLRRIIVTSFADFSLEEIQVPEEVPGVYQFLNLIARYRPKPPKIEIDPVEFPAILQYTGGTTGIPKGTVLTHHNLVSNLIQTAAWIHVKKGKETTLTGLPFFHLAGLAFCLNSVYYAFSQVLVPDPRDIPKTLELIDEYRPTFVANVPTIYMRLTHHPDIKKYDFKSVRACVSGAAPIPPEVIREFEQTTESKILEVYGMTETSPLVTINPMDGVRKLGSVGMPLPDTEVKLVDVKTGTKEVPIGEPGELIVRGPQVMKGYWNKPEETARTLKDGWLYTGDIATMDEDGYFYIVDRKKDMINVSGFKVYPREVDDILFEHPAVAMAAAVGVSDPQRPGSELVKAYIVLKPDYVGRVSSEDIGRYCKRRLAPYKVPKIIEFRKELPTTLVGKVFKRALREEEKERA